MPKVPICSMIPADWKKKIKKARERENIDNDSEFIRELIRRHIINGGKENESDN